MKRCRITCTTRVAERCCPYTAYCEDADTGDIPETPAGYGHLQEHRISLLHLAGVTEITCTFQAIGRDRTRMLSYPPL